jgi:hypothetical protein
MVESSATVTPREFLESWPLYKTLAYDKSFPIPKAISRHCERCDRDTTWACRGNFSQLYNVVLLWFRCNLCDIASVVYTVCRIDGTVTKIGQYPRHSMGVSQDFEKRLGDDGELYRKALVCRTQGYGLAALAYFRRLVENKTNTLVEIVASLASVNPVAESKAPNIRLAKQEATCEQKLRVASEAVPDSLRPGGVNPLGVLHDLFTRKPGTAGEKECLEAVDELREIFDHVFGQLHSQVEDQRRFIENAGKMTARQQLRPRS